METNSMVIGIRLAISDLVRGMIYSFRHSTRLFRFLCAARVCLPALCLRQQQKKKKKKTRKSFSYDWT